MPSVESPVELAGLQAWVGRSETASDVITPRLEASLRAVLDQPPGSPAEGDTASSTVHWCLTPAIAPMSELGPDGHPRRGGFLPPVAMPRRMWAGGELKFHDPLRVGDAVTRVSTIVDVVTKQGRSGTLCFVTVDHAFTTPRGAALDERQDIVYRDMTGSSSAEANADPVERDVAKRRSWSCDPALLFRYSALTFNGHRIHYDRDYARAVEGYADLVVHGPLQAKALLDFATEQRGSLPGSFAFRGVSPLFASSSAVLQATADVDGLKLWIVDGDGRTTMRASARW